LGSYIHLPKCTMVNSYPRQGIVPPLFALQSCNGISEYYQNI
jgi:hypothetical protein